MSTSPRIAAAKRDWGHNENGCTVLHIDMDAFFASVEIARHPELKGKPVIIGTGNRAVVSAASYEARKYGINSAMPASRAHQLCPNGIFLPVDGKYYHEISQEIFHNIFSQVTDRIEQVSVDECYMDVSGALLKWGKPSTIGAWMRAEVQRRFNITCSVGIAGNKMVAKMASTNAKPDGMLLIPLDRHAEFVQMMPLRGIPGIGPSQEKHLNKWGINSVASLARLTEAQLLQITGSPTSAHHLYNAAHGLSESPVVTSSPRKSISAERTFQEDVQNYAQANAMLHRCCDEVAASLRKHGSLARTVTVKLRFPDLSYLTRARTLRNPTDSVGVLYPESLALLKQMLGLPEHCTEQTSLSRPIRLLGMGCSGLREASGSVSQPSLDDLLEETEGTHTQTKTTRMRDAEEALDKVRDKFGKNSAKLGW